MKRGKITFSGDRPLEISDEADQNAGDLSPEQAEIVRKIGGVVKAYLRAVQKLISTKYAHIREWVPVHLADPGTVLVVCCADGVIIRYDRKVDNMRVLSGWMPEALSDVVSLLSQGLIHCYPERTYVSTVATTGTELRLSKVEPITGAKEDFATAKIGFDAVLERPEHLPEAPEKPFCLMSVRNSLEIQILGELLGEGISGGQPQQFLTRTTIRLPVGWECMEVFPFFKAEHWDTKYTALWAEKDVLAAVVAGQFREGQFQSLDPNASARQQFAGLLNDYKALLDSNPEREEILQVFLRNHPALLCPTHTRVWPKLALGARETDFVFLEASGDYVLVELERSTHRLFRKDGDSTQALNHARGQVIDWKRYLEDNLATVQREVGLVGISANPKSLIVIGRSQFLTLQHRRKLVSIENESPRLKIMTYDDVYESAKAVIQNLLGTIWEVYGNTQVYYLQPGRNTPSLR